MHTKIWLLYKPEPFYFNSDDERAIHLWVRRCELFTARSHIDEFLEKILGKRLEFKTHELFPELEIAYDRGYRWLATWAELNPQSRF